MLAICGIVAVLACVGQTVAQASPTPTPAPSPSPGLTDPCGGAAELLKKYLAASPCVFVRGQAGIQATYAGTNTPTVVTLTAAGREVTVTKASQAFGYPGALLNVGVSHNAQVTIVLPSYSQINSTQGGKTAGTSDMALWYKQLLYVDRARGILGGVLLTYQAPTGSPGISAGAPSYAINPLLNIALNKARSIAESLAFPLSNLPASQPGAPRSWTFAPQAVTLWRSPGGTLLAIILQYQFYPSQGYLTINTAQLLSRNLQLQATYGGNNATLDYVNPIQDIGRGTGTSYRRSFTVGFSYLIGGHSELPPP